MLLDTYARAITDRDPLTATARFTTDAVYVEPPDRQRHDGRDQLFAFFGGDQSDVPAASMNWHHVAVDAAAGVAFRRVHLHRPGASGPAQTP